MLNDIDVMRQMYATLCGSIDDALTLLEWGNVWEAKKNLQRGLEIAEELYLAGEQAEACYFFHKSRFSLLLFGGKRGILTGYTQRPGAWQL